MASLYSHSIYPHLMDIALSGQASLRGVALRKAYGDVLEVGFGTGLNLPCYPSTIRKLYALDIANPLQQMVEQRIRRVNFPVERLTIEPAASFPLRDGQFDCVVTTWTLCSVDPPTQLLTEIRRVLRSGGLYIFLEHGKAQSPHTAILQNKLSGISKVLANGCRLDVAIDQVIEQAGYRISELTRFNNARTIRIAAHMYQGIAM